MRMFAKLPAFLSGIAAVVVLNAVLGHVAAQPAGTSPGIDVCVDAESVMRLAGPVVAYNAGERRIPLRGPAQEKACEPLPRKDLGELARRVSELEGRGGDPAASQFVEPFEVLNPAGKRVFMLARQAASQDLIFTDIYNDVGMQVAAIAANAGGGAVTVSNPGSATALGDLSTSISVHGSYLEFTTRVSSDRGIELGRRANGRFGLSVFGSGDKVAAFIGESLAGSGLAAVADAAGVVRASMFRHGDTASGVLRIQSAQNQDLASLSAEGHAGSGLLQLRNNSGEVMVEAGTLNTGVGAVRAGPAAFNDGIMFLGLPASYIVGKKP